MKKYYMKILPRFQLIVKITGCILLLPTVHSIQKTSALEKLSQSSCSYIESRAVVTWFNSFLLPHIHAEKFPLSSSLYDFTPSNITSHHILHTQREWHKQLPQCKLVPLMSMFVSHDVAMKTLRSGFTQCLRDGKLFRTEAYAHLHMMTQHRPDISPLRLCLADFCPTLGVCDYTRTELVSKASQFETRHFCAQALQACVSTATPALVQSSLSVCEAALQEFAQSFQAYSAGSFWSSSLGMWIVLAVFATLAVSLCACIICAETSEGEYKPVLEQDPEAIRRLLHRDQRQGREALLRARRRRLHAYDSSDESDTAPQAIPMHS